MGFFSFIDPLLNSIFLPLLSLGPFWFLIILSAIVSLFITLVYKYTTDQNLMKSLKEEMNELRKQMKELREHPEKMKEVQSKFSQTNIKFMMESFKPTLFYMLPLIIIFGWMGNNLAYEPILPGNEFFVDVVASQNYKGNISLSSPKGVELTASSIKEINDNKAIFSMKAEEGEYLLEFIVDKKPFQKEVVVSQNLYSPPSKKFSNEIVNEIIINNKKLIVMNLFGWQLGWLGSYIIFSIVLGSVFRKLMRVY